MPILHHTLSGNPEAGTCLIFIHGFACNELDWKNQIIFFADEYQTLSCDLRGHGQSVNLDLPHQFDIISLANDVRNLILALAINKPIILIGHSMGVRVVLELYSQISSLVHGLVLIDCGYQQVNNPDFQVLQQDIFQHGFRTMINDFFALTFCAHTSSEIREAVMKNVAVFSDDTGQILYPNIRIYDYYAIKKVLNLINIPALFLQSTLQFAGKRYSIGTVDAQSEWLELVRLNVTHAQIKRIPDTGHFIMLEQPDFTNTSIAEFLQSIEQAH